MPLSKKYPNLPKHKLFRYPRLSQHKEGEDYLKLLVKHAEDTKAAQAYRNNFLESQVRVNLQNEFNRIRGILEHSTLPAALRDRERLEHRKTQLKHMIENSLQNSKTKISTII